MNSSQAGIDISSVQNFLLLRGKPLEALGSMATQNTPLVVITQVGETGHSQQIQNEARTSGGVVSVDNYKKAQNSNIQSHIPFPDLSNGTAVRNVNNLAVPLIGQNEAITSQDFSVAFYQQQAMINHNLIMQQHQTVSALVDKVDGLAKKVENKSGSADENTRVKQLPTQPRSSKYEQRKTHDLSDVSSELENSSSDGEGYESERTVSETKHNNNENTDRIAENSTNK